MSSPARPSGTDATPTEEPTEKLLHEFWNAVCEWERHNLSNDKFTPAELGRAYARAQSARDAIAAEVESLRSALREAQEDTKRLEWLETESAKRGLLLGWLDDEKVERAIYESAEYLSGDPADELPWRIVARGDVAGLRAAIDAAAREKP